MQDNYYIFLKSEEWKVNKKQNTKPTDPENALDIQS